MIGQICYICADKHGIDGGGFWVKRWLHLRDRSTHKPFIVQVYRLAEVGRRTDKVCS